MSTLIIEYDREYDCYLHNDTIITNLELFIATALSNCNQVIIKDKQC